MNLLKKAILAAVLLVNISTGAIGTLQFDSVEKIVNWGKYQDKKLKLDARYGERQFEIHRIKDGISYKNAKKEKKEEKWKKLGEFKWNKVHYKAYKRNNNTMVLIEKEKKSLMSRASSAARFFVNRQ